MYPTTISGSSSFFSPSSNDGEIIVEIRKENKIKKENIFVKNFGDILEKIIDK